MGDKPYVMKPVIASNGYRKVTITHEGKQYIFSIHRLVAKTLIPNINDLPEVNHKDGNKGHNWAWNLEWCTPKENIDHAFRTGLKTGRKGSEHPMHKITEETAVQICELLASGKYSYDKIAELTNSTCSIVKKKLKRVLGGSILVKNMILVNTLRRTGGHKVRPPFFTRKPLFWINFNDHGKLDITIERNL